VRTNNIKGFPNYHWDGTDVWNIHKRRLVKTTTRKGSTSSFVKLKSDIGAWLSVQISRVRSLSGESDVPVGFVLVPHTKGKVFINPNGEIYSCQTVRTGIKLVPRVYTDYPIISINYKDRNRKVEVHQLMCVTFYDRSYIEKGLVCLHKDNDKSNYLLTNLKVGTYSENNKQAYADGINQGNRFGY
jgi:hypothetical protein